jgi:hypothetical protein
MSTSTRKRSEPVERRYVIEATSIRWPKRVWFKTDVPVTPIPEVIKRKFPNLSPKAATRYRRYADAVLVTDEEVMIIEAKVRRPIDGLGQLLLYRHYAPNVTELQRFKPRPFVPTLLIPRVDPFLEPVARANGFKVVIQETEHSMRYLKEKRFV